MLWHRYFPWPTRVTSDRMGIHRNLIFGSPQPGPLFQFQRTKKENHLLLSAKSKHCNTLKNLLQNTACSFHINHYSIITALKQSLLQFDFIPDHLNLMFLAKILNDKHYHHLCLVTRTTHTDFVLLSPQTFSFSRV